MNKFDLTALVKAYDKNLKKIVFLLLILVFFTLTVVYIPFLNVFATPIMGFGIFIVMWYILFPPSIKFLVYASLGLIVLAYIATIFEIGILQDAIGQLLFVLAIFIFINYLKGKE